VFDSRRSGSVQVLAEDRLRRNADLQKLRAHRLDATPAAAIATRVGDVEIGKEPPKVIDVATAKGNDGDKGPVDIEAHCLCEARQDYFF
jgi:hypothetical protein